MSCAVKIPIMYTIIFLDDVPEALDGMEIEEGAWAEVPPNLYQQLEGSGPPERVLYRSTTDPNHYRVFKYPGEVDPSAFTPTGMTYGGFYTSSMWERFSREWSGIRKFYEIPETDPPGAYDEALRILREVR